MAKRKFQTGDVVHLNDKAYLNLRRWAQDNDIQYFEVKGYTTRYSSGEYAIMGFTADGQEVKGTHHPGTHQATASMLVLGKRLTQAESLRKRIGANLKKMEELQRENGKLNGMIEVIEELGVEVLDTKAYSAAKALADKGQFDNIKDAYNMVIMIKEELV